MTTLYSTQPGADIVERAVVTGRRVLFVLRKPADRALRQALDAFRALFDEVTIEVLLTPSSRAANGLKAQTLEERKAERQIDWEDYLGMVMPLLSPVNLFVRKEDVLQEKKTVHIIFYSMGKHKILVSGQYDRDEDRLLLDCSCQYKNGTELQQRIRAWVQNGFTISWSAALNRITTTMAQMEHGALLSIPDLLALQNMIDPPSRLTEKEKVDIESMIGRAPSLVKLAVTNKRELEVFRQKKLKEYRESDIRFRSRDEYEDAKLWVKHLEGDEKENKEALESELRRRDVQSHILDRFHALESVNPEEATLDPEAYQAKQSVFYNHLRRDVNRYERELNISHSTTPGLEVGDLLQKVVEAVQAKRFYTESREACADASSCELGSDDATCYFWDLRKRPPPELESTSAVASLMKNHAARRYK